MTQEPQNPGSETLGPYKRPVGASSFIPHSFPLCGIIRHSLLFAFFALFCGYSSAADKSGVSPNTISLPKGPGAIEGLGESFQPHLNTGTAGSGFALKVPLGTAGHTPALNLSYQGGC